MELQICCVCGRFAENTDEPECECECPTCHVYVFNDVTLVDHHECYDCHQTRLLGTGDEWE